MQVLFVLRSIKELFNPHSKLGILFYHSIEQFSIKFQVVEDYYGLIVLG
jgi:hypothetical protein